MRVQLQLKPVVNMIIFQEKKTKLLNKFKRKRKLTT